MVRRLAELILIASLGLATACAPPAAQPSARTPAPSLGSPGASRPTTAPFGGAAPTASQPASAQVAPSAAPGGAAPASVSSSQAAGAGCATVTVTADPPSPQPQGTTVALTAQASCGGAAAEYRWWELPEGKDWIILREWSDGAYTWNTNTVAAGNYAVGVWARQTGSNLEWQSTFYIPYTLE